MHKNKNGFSDFISTHCATPSKHWHHHHWNDLFTLGNQPSQHEAKMRVKSVPSSPWHTYFFTTNPLVFYPGTSRTSAGPTEHFLIKWEQAYALIVICNPDWNRGNLKKSRASKAILQGFCFLEKPGLLKIWNYPNLLKLRKFTNLL